MAPLPRRAIVVAPRDGNASSTGLSTSDIIGIAVGVPSAVIALAAAIIALLAWKRPTGFAASMKDAILRQRKQTGSNWNSNVMYGGKQTVGTLNFESVGACRVPSSGGGRLERTPGHAVHMGDNINSNVLHDGAVHEVRSMTFGTRGPTG
ncbi:hypothetical protein B0T14DRAFT_539645 [Immersiella caudata]|uniref:Uncharacterized protein n=1 Tax=Immersiella caudata TaxID=314043 RepID=A0AA39WEP1_9PEZI|nr:hypothetical protein B0T14DRAFT_539645 [Immersiella caudata]